MREEVRVTRRGMIAGALPKRGCRAGKHKAYGYTIYLPIERLWLPLVRKLNVETPMPWGSEALNCVVCGKKFFITGREAFLRSDAHLVLWGEVARVSVATWLAVAGGASMQNNVIRRSATRLARIAVGWFMAIAIPNAIAQCAAG